MENIPIIPGRGLISDTAVEIRRKFIEDEGFVIEKIKKHRFDKSEIQNNIESFIGSVEIPVGIAGPLLFVENNKEELVYCVAGTLEGALIASMNRGAKVLSKSSGFNAVVIHQKMIRAPMFLFNNLTETVQFRNWISANFEIIKSVTQKHSNHADLLNIEPFIIGRSIHLKFIYTTGDASGQNMTTSCTWHAMLWISENFTLQTNIEIQHFIIEGNAASDKKVSQASVLNGRGVHVVAECFIDEDVINKVLRTTSSDIFRYFGSSLSMSKIDGMPGYNINVANAIAAIFVATGQDLGSIHESSNGILNIEKTETGLYFSLNLPSLVIATTGGGTHLPKQKEALELMNCYGTGKIERFAKLIAGFSLALEISTYSAIVSGEFAKAHEKLGRNKPVNRLLKIEINEDFIKKCLNKNIFEIENVTAKISHKTIIDNGIITNITNRVSKKIIGFIPVEIKSEEKIYQILLKSKALDSEVIQGICVMAASINPDLSDLIEKHAEFLEYNLTHLKEIEIYESLYENNLKGVPEYFGKYIDKKREIYITSIEALEYSDLKYINSENNPEIWSKTDIENTINSISKIHKFYSKEENRKSLKAFKDFKSWESKDLSKKLISLVIEDTENLYLKKKYAEMFEFIENSEEEYNILKIGKTVIHNDFNSRNIAVRSNGDACIYDWELSVINIPHRDIIEFLSFVLPENFDENTFWEYIDFHFSLYKNYEKSDWIQAYIYAIKEYVTSRVSFYEVAGILMKYEFSNRVSLNSFRMLEILASQI